MSGGSALAAHAYDWVGGDMAGLRALEDECAKVASTLTGADQALSRQVAQVVSAGNWRGAAADAFTSAWDKDSAAGAQLAGAWNKIGAIAGNLASNLATLESALEEAAYQVEKQGVAIDPANGTALSDTTAAGNACPSPQVAARNARLISQYNGYRAKILAEGTAARAQAATALNQITESMLPPQKNWGAAVSGLDAVRGLWAVPTTYRRGIADGLTEAEKTVNSTQRAAWEELIAARKVYGNNALLNPKTRENAADALKERTTLEGKLATAPGEDGTTMLADGDPAALGLTGLASGAIRSVPYIGTVAGTGITIWQDRATGESWGQSVSDGVVSNGAALGAGIAAATIIGGGSVVAVAGGVVVGGVVAVGVGDFVHNVFQENWGGDWHKYGVLDGTAHGITDAAAKTGHDLLHLASDLNPF